MSTILAALGLRRPPSLPAHPTSFPFTAETNPFHAKRHWPPDFSKLSRSHQFRLERRYRRRTKLKWARPGWKKFVTLAQWASILFVGVYGVLYLEMGTGERTVLDGVREWIKEQDRPVKREQVQVQVQKG